MIVLSLVLVIVAAVTLIAGFFQDESLTLIYVAIVSCVLAMAFLGIGVLQRKRSGKPASAGTYGAGAGTSSAASTSPGGTSSSAPARGSSPSITPVRPKEPVSSTSADAGSGEGTQVIVRKTAAADAAKRSGGGPVRKKAVVKKAVAKRSSAAADEAGTKVAGTEKARPAKKASAKAASAKKAPAASGARKSTAKKGTAKKSTAKKSTAKKGTAKKSTAKKSTAKKSTATRSGGKAEARRILASIKGLGPAKQDAVLSEFGSVAALRQASRDQLAEVNGIGEGLADAIKKAVR